MTSVVASSTASDTQQDGAKRPVRLCIGCRGRAVATELLRVVAVPDSDQGTSLVAVPDPRRRMPGRGAWLHPVPACVDLAQRRRAFGRALRVSGTIDAAAVSEYVAAQHGSTTQ